MGIGRPPHNKQDLLAGLFRAADNVVPLRHQGDEFSNVLSPLLEAAATFPDHESPRQGFLSLLEENARLRALAIKLSNLLGDLPAREWEDAGAGGADSPPVRCLPKWHPDQHRPSDVNRFSMMVDDYHGRCRSFRTKSLKDIRTTEHPLIKG
jgi:hypothetical protein